MTTMLDFRVQTPPLSLKDLERIRQERLEEARQKRLLEKAVLVAESDKGKNGYHRGLVYRVAVLPHPNGVDVVRIFLFVKGLYDPAIADFARRQRVIIWVHDPKDNDPERLYGKNWVRVLSLERVVPKGGNFPITDKDKAGRLYVPGQWEEALSAAAAEVAREIAERREAKEAAEAERLWELLFPQRPV